ncbi:MAG: hypothetical protein EBU26_03780 [Verrucomicrobia bacterium]|nr:hypothetical protein [Verrucomicrobiota bacterium]
MLPFFMIKLPCNPDPGDTLSGFPFGSHPCSHDLLAGRALGGDSAFLNKVNAASRHPCGVELAGTVG